MNLWDLKAGLYHAARCMPLIRKILDREIENLKLLLDEAGIHPEEVLDIGIGSGSSWIIFRESVAGFGIDQSHAMLGQAQKRISGLNPVVASALHLPITEGRLQFVSVIGLAEYIRDKAGLLDESIRILKPGGWLLITIPTGGVMNRLRNLLGNPLYIKGQTEWESMLEARSLHVVGKKRSLLQIQYLLQLKLNP
ncbi:methyltransferase domain-containing protein [candidate division KSB1 bacterium]|nr:methyltransferase domain-containing protein [candidate division KSB1 bacterium]